VLDSWGASQSHSQAGPATARSAEQCTAQSALRGLSGKSNLTALPTVGEG